MQNTAKDFYTKKNIRKLLKKNNIDFYCEQNDIPFLAINKTGDIENNRDLDFLPYEVVLKLLGLKRDKGHLYLIMKLNDFDKSWLNTFLKYQRYYEVHDNDGKINRRNVYLLILDIFDGLL